MVTTNGGGMKVPGSPKNKSGNQIPDRKYKPKQAGPRSKRKKSLTGARDGDPNSSGNPSVKQSDDMRISLNEFHNSIQND